MTEDELDQLLAWARSLPEHTCTADPHDNSRCTVCEWTWAGLDHAPHGPAAGGYDLGPAVPDMDPASRAAWAGVVVSLTTDTMTLAAACPVCHATQHDRVGRCLTSPAQGFATGSELR